MPSQKPSILIIHGAWHHPAYFANLINLLKAQGYDAICPRLPTCNNDDPPTKTLADDVALIRSTASSIAEEGHEIVALMHSYGGVVGTDALSGLSVSERAKRGLSGGLKRLVYMCAFIPQMGQSLAGIFGGRLPPWIVDNPPFLDPSDPNTQFYHDVPDAEHWTTQLVKHPRSAQYDDVVSHEAFREVPVSYLLCEDDKALPWEVQRMMIEKIGEAGVKVDMVETCQASHSPFLSMPEKVVEVVVRAAE